MRERETERGERGRRRETERERDGEERERERKFVSSLILSLGRSNKFHFFEQIGCLLV